MARKTSLHNDACRILARGSGQSLYAKLYAKDKDTKTEMMYEYLTGGEFSNHIKYIIESYDEMAKQLDNEKKQAQKRWAAQEKILKKVTSSLYGMSGDLLGIAGREIITLPVLESVDNDIMA